MALTVESYENMSLKELFDIYMEASKTGDTKTCEKILAHVIETYNI